MFFSLYDNNAIKLTYVRNNILFQIRLFVKQYNFELHILLFSAQFPAVKAQGSGLLTADSLMANQVADVTRISDQQLKKPATSDRVLIG